MHQSYEDIRRRIGVPLWHDEHGVPRYDPFEHGLCADIYADECALVSIACQNCGERFNVAFSESPLTRLRIETRDLGPTPAEQIRDGSIHYGDPPRRNCCPAGATMNCLDLMVLEYWRRGDDFTWQRDGSLEVDVATERGGEG